MFHYKRWIVGLTIFFILALVIGYVYNYSSTDQNYSTTDHSTAKIESYPSQSGKGISMGALPSNPTTITPMAPVPSTTDSSSLPIDQPQMIYQANLSVVVKDFTKGKADLNRLMEAHHGSLLSSSEYKTDEEHAVDITFRIPQSDFNTFIQQASALSLTTPSVQISGNDVAEQLVDLNARLKARQESEQRLLDFMKQAKSAQDLLQISMQLDQVQSDIEQLNGQIQYLNNHVAMSTVQVHLSQRFGEIPQTNEPLLQQMWDTFVNSIYGIGAAFRSFLVFLAGALPVILLLGIIATPVAFLVRRYRQK